MRGWESTRSLRQRRQPRAIFRVEGVPNSSSTSPATCVGISSMILMLIDLRARVGSDDRTACLIPPTVALPATLGRAP